MTRLDAVLKVLDIIHDISIMDCNVIVCDSEAVILQFIQAESFKANFKVGSVASAGAIKEVISTGKRDFSPCNACNMLCRQACPQNVFSSGFYRKNLCEKQMKEDEASRVIIKETSQNDSPEVRIKYCRACELACPVGR